MVQMLLFDRERKKFTYAWDLRNESRMVDQQQHQAAA